MSAEARKKLLQHEKEDEEDERAKDPDVMEIVAKTSLSYLDLKDICPAKQVNKEWLGNVNFAEREIYLHELRRHQELLGNFTGRAHNVPANAEPSDEWKRTFRLACMLMKAYPKYSNNWNIDNLDPVLISPPTQERAYCVQSDKPYAPGPNGGIRSISSSLNFQEDGSLEIASMLTPSHFDSGTYKFKICHDCDRISALSFSGANPGFDVEQQVDGMGVTFLEIHNFDTTTRGSFGTRIESFKWQPFADYSEISITTHGTIDKYSSVGKILLNLKLRFDLQIKQEEPYACLSKLEILRIFEGALGLPPARTIGTTN